jgi:hypothetical protein
MLVEQRLPVAKLGGILDLDRQPGEMLEEILAYEAGVPVQSFADSGYTSFTSDESGNRLAILGSECLPASIDALPAYGELRSAVVRSWQDQKYANAYGKIVEAFPEAAVGRREYGRLSVWILPDGEIRKYGF